MTFISYNFVGLDDGARCVVRNNAFNRIDAYGHLMWWGMDFYECRENGMAGPLEGYKAIEMVEPGQTSFCAMMLADMGAEVIHFDWRTTESDNADTRFNTTDRGRGSLGIDLKNPDAAETALTLIGSAGVLIRAFRRCVIERLGLGPEVRLARNMKLVYGRMAGWGQNGPLTNAAGHDIKYIALSEALHAIGRPGEPRSCY